MAPMPLPQMTTLLPELTTFTWQLSADVDTGVVNDWQSFIARTKAFYTSMMMDKIDRLVPGWISMASHHHQQTLIHVTSVLVALFLLPEYHQADPEQQAIMEWTVLLHDIAKVPRPHVHDYVHAFRSASVTGRVLEHIGFPVSDAFADEIEDWCRFTWDAIVFSDPHQEDIQDNRQLPVIYGGIDRMYGSDTPAALIIKAVLLHLSIVTDPDYPTVAPLSDAEIGDYVAPDLYPILRTMMLVDTDAWNLFAPEAMYRQHQQTTVVFDQIASRIGIS